MQIHNSLEPGYCSKVSGLYDPGLLKTAGYIMRILRTHICCDVDRKIYDVNKGSRVNYLIYVFIKTLVRTRRYWPTSYNI